MYNIKESVFMGFKLLHFNSFQSIQKLIELLRTNDIYFSYIRIGESFGDNYYSESLDKLENDIMQLKTYANVTFSFDFIMDEKNLVSIHIQNYEFARNLWKCNMSLKDINDKKFVVEHVKDALTLSGFSIGFLSRVIKYSGIISFLLFFLAFFFFSLGDSFIILSDIIIYLTSIPIIVTFLKYFFSYGFYGNKKRFEVVYNILIKFVGAAVSFGLGLLFQYMFGLIS